MKGAYLAVITRNVIQYLEQSAERYPQKTAFADLEHSYTYAELLERAYRIGSFLAGRIEHGQAVCVYMEKSIEAVAAFMGIVCAGGFYVMLDMQQPLQRIKQILDRLDTKVVITREQEKAASEGLGYAEDCLVYEEICKTGIREEELKRIRFQALDIDPLYAVFTSGSTGTPKGVLVSHRSVIDFIEHFTEIFEITKDDVIGNQAPFDFDVSVKDIYSTLKMGATMQMIPRKFFLAPVKLLDFLCEREVTTIIWAVSALCVITTLKAFRYKVPVKLSKIMFSGELMPINHLREWRRNIPQAVYVNLYGPSEITCNCTYHIIDREYEDGEILPIGIPFPNEKVFLLGEQDQLLKEPNKKGEICVSGTALALGYYRDKQQTDDVFVQNPLNPCYRETIYRTGDLGMYNERGELVFLSRKDFQIKHMGHRIELSEVELAIERIRDIVRVCCMYDEKRDKIIAFYQGKADDKMIFEQLSDVLPSFMIPNQFIMVEEMPLNKNGKIDRNALTKLYGGR